MKCKETKDWFYCLASKGVQFLWSCCYKVINIIAMIITLPLVIIGWFKEKSE